MVLLLPLLEVLLIGHHQQRLGSGILGCLAPAVHLLRKQPPLTAIATQFYRVQPSSYQNHRELVGRPPTLWILLKSRN